jgi:hypothetical protein
MSSESELKMVNGIIYRGQINQSQKPHGRGILFRKDGTKIYEGEFKDGVLNGTGTVFYRDGKTKRYEGEFRDGEALRYNKERDLISDMTPLEISNEIINDINRLEGPVYTALLIPNDKLKQILGYNPPVILLLGDYHTGNDKCTSCILDKKCYSLYDTSFLNYLNTKAVESNWSIDLFLENNWTLKKDLESSNVIKEVMGSSALYNIRGNLKDCIGSRQTKFKPYCDFDNFRTHDTDPRYLNNMKDDRYITQDHKYTGDSLTRRLSYFSKKGSYITIKDINIFKQLLETEFQGFTANEILEQMKKILSNKTPIDFFLDEPFFQAHSRMYHEFAQLPVPIRNTLHKNMKSVYKYTTEEEYEYDQEDLDRYFDLFLNTDKYDPTVSYQTFPDDLTGNINFTLLSVDLYTISRALKKFEPLSQLSVIYQGKTHIMNEIGLLKNYYKIVMEFGSNKELGYTNIKKCVYDTTLTNKFRKTYTKTDNIEETLRTIIKEKNTRLTDARINHIISTYPEIQAYIDLRNMISTEEISELENYMESIYNNIQSIMLENSNIIKLKNLFDTYNLKKFIKNKTGLEIKKILEIFGYHNKLALNLDKETETNIQLYILFGILLMTPEDIINNLSKGLNAPISDLRDCRKQNTKLYKNRKSPPYPSNQCCGKILLGNDKQKYISKADKNGRCTWRKL